MLTDAQLGEFGLADPGVGSAAAEGPRCEWRGASGTVLGLTLYTNGGGIGMLAQNSEPSTRRVRVAGYPALETFTGRGEFCQYDVGVSDRQVVMASLEAPSSGLLRHAAADGAPRRGEPAPGRVPVNRSGLIDSARTVLSGAVEAYRDEPRTAQWLTGQLRRLDEPLRIAIAGKVKAGKSTLLNALVGEQVAATDAGECTQVVTWYRDGHSPRVEAHPDDRSAGAAAGRPPGRRADRSTCAGTPPTTWTGWSSTGRRRACAWPR